MNIRNAIMLTCVLTVASWSCAEPPPAIPPIPSTPAAVDNVLYARAFELTNGEKFLWSKERPDIKTGTLLVLEVDTALVFPRAAAMPVLYVGDRTAQRVNDGHKSGRVIAIVPGEVDLLKDPIWFGTPDLPDRVDANMAKAERSLADAAGIKPFPEKKVKAALAKGGEKVTKNDMHALLRDQVAELILEYSPDEKHLADGFRVPVLKRDKPKKPAKPNPSKNED
jgi:hypothetical protein